MKILIFSHLVSDYDAELRKISKVDSLGCLGLQDEGRGQRQGALSGGVGHVDTRRMAMDRRRVLRAVGDSSRIAANSLSLAATAVVFLLLSNSNDAGWARGLSLPAFLGLPFAAFASIVGGSTLCGRDLRRACGGAAGAVVAVLWITGCAVGSMFASITISYFVNDTRLFREPHGALVGRIEWISSRLLAIGNLEAVLASSLLLAVAAAVVEALLGGSWGRDLQADKPGDLERRKTIRRDENVYEAVEGGLERPKVAAFEIEKGADGDGEGGDDVYGREPAQGTRVLWIAVRALSWANILAGFGLVAFGVAVIIQRAQFIKLHWAPPPHVSCSNSIDGNPICMLPFPSDRLLHESNHTVTGRVFDVKRNLGVPLRTGKMLSFRGHHDDGSLPAVPDGFSSMTPIMAWMPGCELGEWPGRYYEDEAAGEGQFTAVIDVAANSSVAHAAFRHGKLLVLQPLDPLPANSRIAVGVKRGIRGEGTRWSEPPNIPQEAEATAALARLGWDPERIDLAWTFHTASAEATLAPARDRVEEALDWYRSSGGAKNEIVRLVDEADKCDVAEVNQTAFIIHGRFEGPSFVPDDLSNTRNHYVGESRMAWHEYTVRVPCALLDKNRVNESATVVHYSHGFLGARGEILGDYLGELSNRGRWVLVATDTYGLTRHDLPYLLQLCVSHASLTYPLADLILQSQVNRVLLEEILVNELPMSDPRLMRLMRIVPGPTESRMPYAYYGNSLGGILGLSLSSLSIKVRRSVLGVAGLPFGSIMRLSDQFDGFKQLLLWQFRDSVGVEILIAASQSFWDLLGSAWFRCYGGGAGDCSAVAPRGQNFSEKSFLIQNGVVDDSVDPVAGHVLARALGAEVVNPVRRIPSLTNRTRGEGDTGRSQIVEWLPRRNLHRCLRLQPAAKAQVSRFVSNGQVDGSECGFETCLADVTIDEACDIDSSS